MSIKPRVGEAEPWVNVREILQSPYNGRQSSGGRCRPLRGLGQSIDTSFPRVPLRSTLGFMLPPTPRAGHSIDTFFPQGSALLHPGLYAASYSAGWSNPFHLA